MLLGCLKTLQRPYQILDWYWALAFLWQNNNIAKCADGRVGKPHSKGSKFLVSKCLYCFSPDWLEKPPHSSHFPKCYSKRHQKPFVRQMSCRSWEKVAVNTFTSVKVWGLGFLLLCRTSSYNSWKVFTYKPTFCTKWIYFLSFLQWLNKFFRKTHWNNQTTYGDVRHGKRKPKPHTFI